MKKEGTQCLARFHRIRSTIYTKRTARKPSPAQGNTSLKSLTLERVATATGEALGAALAKNQTLTAARLGGDLDDVRGALGKA